MKTQTNKAYAECKQFEQDTEALEQVVGGATDNTATEDCQSNDWSFTKHDAYKWIPKNMHQGGAKTTTGDKLYV